MQQPSDNIDPQLKLNPDIVPQMPPGEPDLFPLPSPGGSQ